MRNMKIKVEINEQGKSNLDEVVAELERLGCKQVGLFKKHKWIYASESKSIWFANIPIYIGKLTTLAELRSMNIETLKDM